MHKPHSNKTTIRTVKSIQHNIIGKINKFIQSEHVTQIYNDLARQIKHLTNTKVIYTKREKDS